MRLFKQRGKSLVGLMLVMTGCMPLLFAAEKDEFKKNFESHGCAKCHSLSALSRLSDRVMKHPLGPRSFLREFLTKKIKRGNSKHMFRFRGSQEDLDRLIEALLQMNQPEKQQTVK